MKYLRISSEGAVAPEAFTLVGASTKRNDSSKIGMFGSGNKYALAFFMRNKMDFRVWSQTNEIAFTTRAVEFGGEKFDVVVVDGRESSITTEMGFKWSLWQAVREIYSNAVDAGLISLAIEDGINCYEDHEATHIFIEATPEIEDFFFNIRDYFALDKETLYQDHTGSIYRKHSPKPCIYRKGIKAVETKKPTIFDYDINRMEINEDRLASYSWVAPMRIWDMLYKCNDPFIIRTVVGELESGKDYFENKIDDTFVDTDANKLSPAWGEFIANYKICPRIMGGYLDDEDRAKTKLLPTQLYKDLIAKFGDKAVTKSFKTDVKGNSYTRTQPTALALRLLEEVLEFFKEAAFEIPYPVDIVNFHETRIAGSIEGEVILIDKDAFDNGKDWIASIILEEYVHIKHQVKDETRAFQNATFAEIITYMKKTNSLTL